MLAGVSKHQRKSSDSAANSVSTARSTPLPFEQDRLRSPWCDPSESPVAAVEYLQPIPITPHSAEDDRREHFPEHLDQHQQRPVIGQTDVAAALVDVVNEIDVPRTWRHLGVLGDVAPLHRPLYPALGHAGIQVGAVARKPRSLRFRYAAKLPPIVAKPNCRGAPSSSIIDS